MGLYYNPVTDFPRTQEYEDASKAWADAIDAMNKAVEQAPREWRESTEAVDELPEHAHERKMRRRYYALVERLTTEWVNRPTCAPDPSKTS